MCLSFIRVHHHTRSHYPNQSALIPALVDFHLSHLQAKWLAPAMVRTNLNYPSRGPCAKVFNQQLLPSPVVCSTFEPHLSVCMSLSHRSPGLSGNKSSINLGALRSYPPTASPSALCAFTARLKWKILPDPDDETI